MECNELHDFQRATKTRKGIDKENIRSRGATKDAQGLHYWRQAQRELSYLQLFHFSIPELDSSLFSPSPNNSWPKKGGSDQGKTIRIEDTKTILVFSGRTTRTNRIFAFDVAKNRLISLYNARKLNRRKRENVFKKHSYATALHRKLLTWIFPRCILSLLLFFSPRCYFILIHDLVRGFEIA